MPSRSETRPTMRKGRVRRACVRSGCYRVVSKKAICDRPDPSKCILDLLRCSRTSSARFWRADRRFRLPRPAALSKTSRDAETTYARQLERGAPDVEPKDGTEGIEFESLDPA